jgi:hypothetical protein
MSAMAIAGSRRSSTRQPSNWGRFTNTWWAMAGLSPTLWRRLAKARHSSTRHWTCKAHRPKSKNLSLQDEYLPLLQLKPFSGTLDRQPPCSREPWIKPLSVARSEQLSEYPKVYGASPYRSAQLSDACMPTAGEGDSDGGRLW